MRRVLEGMEVVLFNGWVVAVVDAMLLCLGLTCTLASLAPTLRSAIERRRARRPPQPKEELPMLRRLLAIAIFLAIVVPVPVPGWAATSPGEQLRGQVERVLRVLEDPELRKEARTGERRAAIRAAASELFDLPEITRRSLGQHWTARTPAERDEIVRLFGELLERSYLGKIETFNGERIAWAGESVQGDQATVRTRIVTKSGTEIPVDYRLGLRGERWLVYDVTIEGVSLVANYRGQFNKIIQAGSFADLVKRLRAKLEEPAEGPARVKSAGAR
jgi:phospholipid transport system substrate-binding protein